MVREQACKVCSIDAGLLSLDLVVGSKVGAQLAASLQPVRRVVAQTEDVSGRFADHASKIQTS